MGGGWLAVVEDGLSGAHLERVAADGTRERIVRVNRGARVDVAADGGVLVAQPDVCRTLYYAYDVYRLRGRQLQPLSHCAHLRRAVQAGPAVLALQLDGGRTRLVQLQTDGQPPRVLLAPADGTELVDLAAAPDGRLGLITRQGSDWRVIEIDPTRPQAAPRVLLRRAQPLQALRHGSAGLELVSAEGGVPNVWRLQGGQLQRLTHSHTAVLTHAGTAADGSLVSVVIVPQGVALRRLAQPVVLQSGVAVADPAPGGPGSSQAPAADPTAAPATALSEGRSYSALRALAPRSWLPAASADRGLTAYGASTSGADALGWHRYAAMAMWETSQKELTGSLEYLFVGSHGLSFTRELAAQAWTTVDGKDTARVFDRSTRLQWLSRFPFTRVERRVVLGVGAAGDWTDRVDLGTGAATATTARRRDERLLAALLDIDVAQGDWHSEGRNRGAQGTLLVESYRPLTGGDPRRYDGTVARADLRAYLPTAWLGPRSVLALRYTEARARGRTEPFQLGGATDELLQLGPTLNNRTLSLRGYRGDEPALRGANVRVATVEWRTPLVDIDRHAMVPPVGINRLSATVFMDVGGAWNTGNGPAAWRRGVGAELLGEVKLLYALGLQLRLGVAQGLDAPKETRAYLKLGRAF